MTDEPIVITGIAGGVARVTLNDPDRRNALGYAMFERLADTLDEIATRDDTRVVLLHGNGKAFCAGFDLTVTADDAVGVFIGALSGLLRALRRLPQPVVGAIHGAAIAGGCALVSACDLVVVSAGTKLGYPVHRLGVSPAVSIPTLHQAAGTGAARSMMLGGKLIDGRAAYAIGLADRLCERDADVLDDAARLAETLAGFSPETMRATKAWLNELDGSLLDARFDGPADDSAALADTAEARRTLREALER